MLDMYLCMDYVKFVLEAPSAKTFTVVLLFLWGCYYFVTIWDIRDITVLSALTSNNECARVTWTDPIEWTVIYNLRILDKM